MQQREPLSLRRREVQRDSFSDASKGNGKGESMRKLRDAEAGLMLKNLIKILSEVFNAGASSYRAANGNQGTDLH